ncbi:MAG TPA: ribokinase [Rhodopila sp.]|nr:ribokinase [Rhodopila sp.]
MITVFGSINLDLIFNVAAIPRPGETVLGPSTRIEPGGKGANQAVAAARDGASVAMAGAVGADALGDQATELLRRSGVDLSRVARSVVSTGCASIVVDPHGANAIAVGSGANLLARADELEDALLSGTVVLQMEVPAEENAAVIARTRALGGRIILNLAPAAPLPEDALRMVDILVVNETESVWLADHLGCTAGAAALRDRLGGVTVVLTLGENGAEVATQTETWRQPAARITAVDTTAAGDCFVGVLASRLDAGAPLRQAVAAASRAAALCCTRAGSQGSLPGRAETEAFAG